MSDAKLTFLPWVRRGAAAGLLTADTLGAVQPGQATALVTLTINGTVPAVAPVTVMGPGQVTGLDGRQVIRTDPAPGSRSFEPNYVPLVELDEPALPWLFTPAGADAQSRLRPWLCLAVVRPRDGVELNPPSAGSLPVLRIGRAVRPADELPDLAESWAWAHAQVIATAGADLSATLAAHPEASLARLLCPRVLEPNTDYLACVVPTFELGRKAGLGQPITSEDQGRLAPAWDAASVLVELPVYYSWTFATGPSGDFESLAKLLRRRPLLGDLGARSIGVGRSGLRSGIPADTVVELAGALRPVGSTEPAWPTAALEAAWQTALAPVVNAPSAVPVGEDPLLAPTLYGAVHAGRDRVVPAQTTRWFEQLNLSPTHRAVAHLGTRVVQLLQDQLMAAAWAQAAELRRVNQLLHAQRLGCRLATSLHTRHLAPMDPAIGLHVLAPAQARMVRSARGSVPGTGLAARLAVTGLDGAAFATALRRIARPRGAINRRVQHASAGQGLPVGTASVLFRLQPAAVLSRRAPPSSTRVTLSRLADAAPLPGTDLQWSGCTPDAVAAAQVHPTFAFVPLGQPVPPRGLFPHHFPGPTDSPAAVRFRALAQAHLARFNPARVVPVASPQPTGLLADAFGEALARTVPAESYADRARAVIAVADGSRDGADPLEPVRLSPRFPQPMGQALAELAQDLVLPGLDAVPPNTVVPLQTNPQFVEAFLVGLNTEAGRELLWRGYPADLSATFFDRFWDASSAPGRWPDIDPIATWGDRPLGGPAGDPDFVLLVRSELLSRYPDAVIYATRGAEERHPIFTGGFAPDVRYAGFDIPSAEIGDWSIVLMEHPSAPRFGVEVDAAPVTGTHRTPSGPNAASTAGRLRQLPVRITIPVSFLLRSS